MDEGRNETGSVQPDVGAVTLFTAYAHAAQQASRQMPLALGLPEILELPIGWPDPELTPVALEMAAQEPAFGSIEGELYELTDREVMADG